jgi:hypothetical protein
VGEGVGVGVGVDLICDRDDGVGVAEDRKGGVVEESIGETEETRTMDPRFRWGG